MKTLKKVPASHIAIRSFLVISQLLSMPLYAASGSEMKIHEGAYTDSFGKPDPVCVTKKSIETLSFQGWEKKMSKLGHSCSLDEPNQQSLINDSWNATCTSAADPTKNNYRINLSFYNNKLMIDSKIETATGALKLKKAFLGEYKGACDSNMPLLDSWSYLNLPAPLSTAELKARKLVAADMIRCGNVFNAFSLIVVKEKQTGMMSTANALLATAQSLIEHDSEFYLRELNRSAAEVSASLIPLPSIEKRLEMALVCTKYTVPEGVTNAIKEQTAILEN